MGIADTEQKILEELQLLSNEPEKDIKSAEELLEEATENSQAEEETNKSEEDNDSDELPGQDNDEEAEDSEIDEDVEEKPEPELTGAKFRHKLKAEKETREQRERENQELREKIARLEGQANATTQPEAIKEEIPDQEYEPEKYAIYQNSKLEQRVKEMEAAQKRVAAERQWDSMESEHVRLNPDYNNAKLFLLKHHADQIKTKYPYATDTQIAQVLKQGEYEEVAKAANMGWMPTEYFEIMAIRAGYKPDNKAAEAPKKKPNIKAIKKNAKKNASLIGGSSAGETGDGRTADQLLAMSIQDIEKFGKDKFAQAIKKLEARAG